MMAKVSREDEIQADRYGLQLMSRAGYDPESMVTMMAHLGVLQDEHSDAVSKYLEDHPDPSARVAHLMGYPELDPKTSRRRKSSFRPRATRSARATTSRSCASIRSCKTDPQQRRSAARARAIRTRARPYRARASRRSREAAQLRIAADARRRQSAHRRAAPDGSAARHADQAEPAETARRPCIAGAGRAVFEPQPRFKPARRKARISSNRCRAAWKRSSTRYPTSAASTFAAARASKRSSRTSPRWRARSTARSATLAATRARSAASVRSKRTKRAACSRRAPTSTTRCWHRSR